MQAAHHRPAGGDQGFHLKRQVIEKLAEALAEGALVVAHIGVEADPFHQKQTQPGLHPDAQTDAEGAFAEALAGDVGIGNALVVRAALLCGRCMAQQVEVEFKRKRTTVDQALVEADPGEVLRTPPAVEEEAVTEVGVDHLTAPGGHRPVVRMPVGDRRQDRRAGQRSCRCQRHHRCLFKVKVGLAAIEVEDAVDIVGLTAAFEQAVAQLAGLHVLQAPLQPYAACDEHRAAAGFVFESIGQQAASGQHGLHVAFGDHPAGGVVVVELVGAQFELQWNVGSLGQTAGDRADRSLLLGRGCRRVFSLG